MKIRKCPNCGKIIGLSKYGLFHRHTESKGIVCSNSWKYDGDIKWDMPGDVRTALKANGRDYSKTDDGWLYPTNK